MQSGPGHKCFPLGVAPPALGDGALGSKKRDHLCPHDLFVCYRKTVPGEDKAAK